MSGKRFGVENLGHKRLSDPVLIKRKKDILSQPVTQIDLEKSLTIKDLVASFQGASIQARSIGEVARIYEQMLTDPERPTIILGLAGPLIAAGLRKVLRDLIVYGLVDCVVATGAIWYQDYYQAHGYQHFIGTPDADDRVLRDLLVDRIYDTYVDEEKFSLLDAQIGRFADQMPPGNYSSRTFLEALARSVQDPDSILATAYQYGTAIFSPALNDSSIGIGLTEHYDRMKKLGQAGVVLNAIRDNYELTQIVVKSQATAAIYVAGGVPKNFVNDSIVSAYVLGRDTGGHKYAIQMTTDAPHWGGLSGSTLTEARSWGKVSRNARTATAFVEPSVALPLVAGDVLQKRLYLDRARIRFHWDDDRLERISFGSHDSKTATDTVQGLQEV
ncbi:MAG: hypothetical protein A3G87_03410 [Omnitrophica bacterium RIFCSPLOWO2_12_FULL_50_11]|nr:MAG: hypothetical protein A3G87_03410 [Omnitrophica bacterium RIFCSPLOWO2_12_FULL_50_11]